MLKQELTEQELLKKVDDYNIFNHYFGAFDMNKVYPSVFRKDTNPSTGFFITQGRVIYNDLATGEKLNCINFVAKMYGLNYFEAIDKIAKDFGVIEGVDTSKRVAIKKYKPLEKRKKNYEVIKGRYRPHELAFWRQFAIEEHELLENFIYPCREVKVDGWVIENPKDYMRFLYLIKDISGETHMKIYTPHDPVYKWIGSVPKTALFGLSELPFDSDTLIITKGQKDRLIWKKYFTNVVATQSENKGSIPDDVAELFNNNFTNIYVNFDCDTAGKTGSKYYTETYGWKHINVPNPYYEKFGIKDFADVVKEKGLKTFENYIKWKGLLKG